MLEPYPQHASKLAIRTAIAVVFTIYGNNAPNPEIGSQSDVLCWLIVLLLTVATRRKYAKAELGGIYNDWKRYSVSSWGTLWTVATCISLSLWYTAEYGSVTLYVSLEYFLHQYCRLVVDVYYSQCFYHFYSSIRQIPANNMQHRLPKIQHLL